MRIGLAQIAPRLGDFAHNADLILKGSQEALRATCDLVVFPELSLLGYPPLDLLERPEILKMQDNQLEKLIKVLPPQVGVLFGLVERAVGPGKPLYDSAVLVYEGKVQKQFRKELLPTYDVFDESRFFRNGRIDQNRILFKGVRLQVLICEDMWGWNHDYEVNPILSLPPGETDLILNLSASPYEKGKRDTRHQLAAKTVQHLAAPLCYINQVGGQDELIFDGQSFAMGPQGELIEQAQGFKPDFMVFDLKTSSKQTVKPKPAEPIDELRAALVLGIRDFFIKNGMSKGHLGLSGGVDSAVVLCLMAEAIGAENVMAIALPTVHNAPESLSLAEEMAEKVGVGFTLLPIQDLFEKSIETYTKALGPRSFSLLHENLQARLRGLLLMAYSNDQRSLLLSTSNKSELMMGYSTLYGDQCGALAPLGDLVKEEVYALANLYSSRQKWIPSRVIERPPSAELRPNQKDSDSLPEYPELDQAVNHLIANRGAARSPLEKRVLGASLASEFKRWQAPPILKVSSHAFGRGRRLPIAGASLMDLQGV